VCVWVVRLCARAHECGSVGMHLHTCKNEVDNYICTYLLYPYMLPVTMRESAREREEEGGVGESDTHTDKHTHKHTNTTHAHKF
jgi:hypothetical protein